MTEKTISIWFSEEAVEGQVDEHEVRPLGLEALGRDPAAVCGLLSRTGFHGDRVSWLPLLVSRERFVSVCGA
jgi:hypothetical protein